MTPLMILLVRGNKVTFIRAAKTLNEREEFLHSILASVLLPQFENPQPISDEELQRGPQPEDKVLHFCTDEGAVLHCMAEGDCSELAGRLMSTLSKTFNMAAREDV